MTPSSTVRIGLVGTSWWADSMYLPALADHPVGRITTLCGRDHGRARALADRWGVPGVSTDWQAMVDSGDLDAVIVASPNETHRDITLAALERGLPVLCEKPMTVTVEEAEDIAETARRRVRGCAAAVPCWVVLRVRRRH